MASERRTRLSSWRTVIRQADLEEDEASLWRSFLYSSTMHCMASMLICKRSQVHEYKKELHVGTVQFRPKAYLRFEAAGEGNVTANVVCTVGLGGCYLGVLSHVEVNDGFSDGVIHNLWLM